jgi:hypothetical protein
MIWDLPAIAGFAEQGGFLRDQLAEAMAIAVVASSGDDSVVEAPMFGDLPVTAGLWQVPVADRVGFDIESLLQPTVCARAAHTLWKEAGKSWAWSPAYLTGRWTLVIDNAWEVVRSGQRRQLAATLGPRDRLAGSARRAGATSGLTAQQLSGLARILRDSVR